MSRRGPENPNWRGGRVMGPDGRAMVYAPDYPGPKVAGIYVLEYRLVMEQVLGRLLEPHEIVHHVNGNPHDNRPENLEVMTQAEHARLHVETRRDPATGRFLSKKRRAA